MLETQRLTEERQYGKAVVNVAASLVAGAGCWATLRRPELTSRAPTRRPS